MQVAAEAFHEATIRAHSAADGSHSHTAAFQQQQPPLSPPAAPAAADGDSDDGAACPQSPPSLLPSLERARALGKAFGTNAEGFEAAVLWPAIVGVYQLPLDQVGAVYGMCVCVNGSGLGWVSWIVLDLH